MPTTRTAYLGHLVMVKVQREACAVVVQVGRAWQAGGAGQRGLRCAALPPGCTGRLQALARGPLPALLPWWALGAQGVRPAGQQARLSPAPHLGRHTRGGRDMGSHRHTQASRGKIHGQGQQVPGLYPTPPTRDPRLTPAPGRTPAEQGWPRGRVGTGGLPALGS